MVDNAHMCVEFSRYILFSSVYITYFATCDLVDDYVI